MFPKVTVIVPNYNHARYLSARLDSVLGQTYQNLEVLLLDDCSSDESRHILIDYASRDLRVRLVLNEHNSGSTFKQWNKGIALATGEYVWIAESDDVANLTLLETLIGRLEANPAAGLAYCQSWIINAAGEQVEDRQAGQSLADQEADWCLPGKLLVEKYMPVTNIIPNASAVVMRRNVLAQVGAAPEDMRLAGDWLFWVRCFLLTDICFVSQPLNYFRTHSQNVRANTLREGLNLREMAKVLHFIVQKVQLREEVYEKALDMLVERWFHTFIYSPLTWQGHQAFMREMQIFEPNFSMTFRKRVLQRLGHNRLSGLKMLLADKMFSSIRRYVRIKLVS